MSRGGDISIPQGWSLRASLESAAASNQPRATVESYDLSPRTQGDQPVIEPRMNDPVITSFNDTTTVTILDGPTEVGKTRIIPAIRIWNRSTASEIVNIILNDGSTNFVIFEQTLATLESAHYDRGYGWKKMGP